MRKENSFWVWNLCRAGYAASSFERMTCAGICVCIAMLLLSPASASEILITNNTSITHLDPDISGALVSYIARTPEGDLLQVFNLTGNETSTIRNYALRSSSPQYAESLCISGDRAAWLLYGNDTQSIIVYNITTRQETRIASIAGYPDDLQMDGNWLTWAEYQEWMHWIEDPVYGPVEVFDLMCSLHGYNLSTQTGVPITNMPGFDGDADLDRGRVVFTARPNNSSDIFLYDLSSGELTQITNDSVDQYNPAVSRDYLVWEEKPSTGMEVYLYHISGRNSSLIVDNVTDSDLEGDRAVWIRHFANDTALYAYSISTGNITRITPAGAFPTDEYAPSNDYIVWRDWRMRVNGSIVYQIYAAPLPAEGLHSRPAGEGNGTSRSA